MYIDVNVYELEWPINEIQGYLLLKWQTIALYVHVWCVLCRKVWRAGTEYSPCSTLARKRSRANFR